MLFFGKKSKKKETTNVDEIIRKSNENLKRSQDINNDFAALSGEFLSFAQKQSLTVRF
jgi:hypothetical protein